MNHFDGSIVQTSRFVIFKQVNLLGQNASHEIQQFDTPIS
jgi:hypothetical protein